MLSESNRALIASKLWRVKLFTVALGADDFSSPAHMAFRNPHVGMGGTALEREYEITLTDVEVVRATIAAARTVN